MQMSKSEFVRTMVEMTPHFDEMILREMRPVDSWVGKFTSGSLLPPWFEVRELVRKIAEGKAYRPTEYDDKMGRFEWDTLRFRDKTPKTSSKGWKTYSPCDL